MKKRRGAFYFPIIILIVCIAAMSQGAVSNYLPVYNDAKNTQAYSDTKAIGMAIQEYRTQVKSLPPNLDALEKKSGVYGPWIKLPEKDPWGTTNAGINGNGGSAKPYCYAFSATGFAVWSLGKDKVNNSGGSGNAPPSEISGDDQGFVDY